MPLTQLSSRPNLPTAIRTLLLAGFSRFIAADNGQTYHMPWAEYNGSGNLNSGQVRDIARSAANTTGKSNAVFVTEALSRAWVGLPLQ